MQGLIGKKLGMTQVYDDSGNRVAVTVIEAGPCTVLQRKTKERDGYNAVQLGFGDVSEYRMTKADMGRFKKAQTTPKRWSREFSVEDGEDIKEGDTITASIFKDVVYVDVSGVTKGRGFQGVVKRHRMAGGRMTHGGHSKRRVGAIGQCSTPARVVKGKRMPGHMGAVKVTQQNLRIVELRGDENLILVRGAVCGPTGATVAIKRALKK